MSFRLQDSPCVYVCEAYSSSDFFCNFILFSLFTSAFHSCSMLKRVWMCVSTNVHAVKGEREREKRKNYYNLAHCSYIWFHYVCLFSETSVTLTIANAVHAQGEKSRDTRALAFLLPFFCSSNFISFRCRAEPRHSIRCEVKEIHFFATLLITT